MATVYLAHDLKHDRPVAIKVLRPELAAALGPERFLREIQIAAKLNHPHILALHDSGEAGGLLYYVMPHVEGESLQERVAREKRLPIEDAVRIGQEVASALAYAHARGVIHRDIKPGNILLSNSYAMVADFGLARAISQAQSSSNITQGGLALGTPSYMSPEQAHGETELDGRCDIYALGCVLYELLVGSPPFTASNPAAVLARHGTARVQPIRTLRPEVPAGAERAVLKALEKAPADRFQKAEEMGAALVERVPGGRKRSKVASLLVGIGGLALLALVLKWAGLKGPPDNSGATALDTTRLAVFPFENDSTATGGAFESSFREALSHWTGITVVDRPRFGRSAARPGGVPPDEARVRQTASDLAAGRYIRGQLRAIGDSVLARAQLHETVSGEILAETSIRLTHDQAGYGPAADRIASSLLFRDRLAAETVEGSRISRSVPAIEAFISGRLAIDGWDLIAADSAFADALAFDPDFTQASFWLAELRAWQGHPPRVWRLQAEEALTNRSRLSERDGAIASALSAFSQRDYHSACAQWAATTVAWPQDFATWYGSALCLSSDDAIQRDGTSPSKWKFRSSVQQAQLAWRRAFELHPEVLRDFLPSGRRLGQGILWVRPNRVRGGQALAPDTGSFSAFPSWNGDTLAFIPYREREFYAGRAVVAATSTQEAIRHQRRTLYDLASEWRSASPRSLAPREAVATALGLLGNPSAPDSMHAARAMATTPEDRIRLGLTEALMLVLQGGLEEKTLIGAKRLVDSLLGAAHLPGDRLDPWDLATMAALTGRAVEAAQLTRLPSPRTAWVLPPGLASDALGLLAFASLGGPTESLAVLERRVDQGIATAVDSNGRVAARMEWLARPASIAHFDYPFPSLQELAGFGDYLIEAELAYQAGDTAATRHHLADAATGRAWMQPSDLSLETLHPEARLLAAIGDTRGAIDRIDPTLSSLRYIPLDLVRSPVGAGMLVRAMALRAELAAKSADPTTAARWARAVKILWSDADPFLQPLVARMRHLARGERA
jgi:TolB-like protein